jgi:hypothetical protein
MSAETDDLSLIELLQLVNGQYRGSATYSQLWAKVTAGQVPAQRVGSRIRVKRSDALKAAEALGLTRCQIAA